MTAGETSPGKDLSTKLLDRAIRTSATFFPVREAVLLGAIRVDQEPLHVEPPRVRHHGAVNLGDLEVDLEIDEGFRGPHGAQLSKEVRHAAPTRIASCNAGLD